MVVGRLEQDNLLDFADLCSPYVRGDGPIPPWPLKRYFPEIPAELIPKWLSPRLPRGSLILDPFGTSPSVLIELARQGYRVVTCILNPVVRLILETGSHGYSQMEAQAALYELFNSKKENSRFDAFIKSFYQTICASCGKLIQADEYTWMRGTPYPALVIYDCQECGTHNEHEPTDADKKILDQINRNPLYRPLAMDRIFGQDPDLRSDAQEVLSCHLPRSLYLIVALFSRVEGLLLNRDKKKLLQSLIIDAVDASNTLWPVDQPNYRPLQLNIPPHFRELNLFKSLSQTVKSGQPYSNRVRVLHFPELPSAGEISIFSGRVRDLFNLGDQASFDAIVTVLPRPNQAFWKLSATWSAWFMAGEDIQNFTRVISRDRYDWTWHANALFNTFQSIQNSGKIKGGIFGILPEAEPAFLSCALPAVHRAGWKIESFALGPEDHLAEISWKRSDTLATKSSGINRTIESGAQAYLKFKGEPADYLEMTCASLLQLESAGQVISEQNSNSVQTQLRTAFSDPVIFNHIGPGEQTHESGHWWLKTPIHTQQTASDFIELEILRILNEGRDISPAHVEDMIRIRMPANFSEIRAYIHHVMNSYAELISPTSDTWRIKDREKCECRQQEVEKRKDQARSLGEKFGCNVEGDQPIIWRDKFYKPIYRFYIYYHTAFLGELLQVAPSESRGIIVLPASRLDMLAFKQKENPAMHQLLSSDWHLVKFRLMSRLVDNPMVTLESFSELLKADPAETDPDQLFLF